MQGRPLTGWLGRGRLLQQSLGWILSLPISQAWLRDMLRLLRFAALVLPALTLDKQHARDIGVCMVGQLRGAGGVGGRPGPSRCRVRSSALFGGICDASDLLSFFQASKLRFCVRRCSCDFLFLRGLPETFQDG